MIYDVSSWMINLQYIMKIICPVANLINAL